MGEAFTVPQPNWSRLEAEIFSLQRKYRPVKEGREWMHDNLGAVVSPLTFLLKKYESHLVRRIRTRIDEYEAEELRKKANGILADPKYNTDLRVRDHLFFVEKVMEPDAPQREFYLDYMWTRQEGYSKGSQFSKHCKNLIIGIPVVGEKRAA